MLTGLIHPPLAPLPPAAYVEHPLDIVNNIVVDPFLMKKMEGKWRETSLPLASAPLVSANWGLSHPPFGGVISSQHPEYYLVITSPLNILNIIW